jgi:hypothetical protein
MAPQFVAAVKKWQRRGNDAVDEYLGDFPEPLLAPEIDEDSECT